MKKKAWILTGCAAAFLLGAGGAKMYADYQEREELLRRQEANEKTAAALKVSVDPEFFTCEYGSEFDPDKLVKSHTGELSFEGEVNTMEPGNYTLTVKLSDLDAYGEKAEAEFLYSILVEDTQAPVIELNAESETITEGDDYDPADSVVSVTDPVDGELPYDENETKGAWRLEGAYDPDTPGEYVLCVKAADKNGNESSREFTLIVNEKPAAYTPPAGTNPYYIRINRALNTVTVYALSDAGEYEPYTAFICSTGAATPLGTYTTFGKSRWRLLYGPCYGQYATDIVGDILFHSVPYYTQYEGDLEYIEYNKLGTSASMGCIRLCVRDALWIYNNCPVGTVVDLYDDWESYGPLGRPESIYIDPESPNRGWDPTDPSASNPWNS